MDVASGLNIYLKQCGGGVTRREPGAAQRADNHTVKKPLWIWSMKQMRTDLCEVRGSAVATLKESLWFGGGQPSRHEGGQVYRRKRKTLCGPVADTYSLVSAS